MIPDDVAVVVSSSMLAVFVGNEPKLASAGKIECDTMMSTLHNQNEIWGLLFLQLIFTATMWDILNAPRTIVWVSSQGNLKHDFSCFYVSVKDMKARQRGKLERFMHALLLCFTSASYYYLCLDISCWSTLSWAFFFLLSLSQLKQ